MTESEFESTLALAIDGQLISDTGASDAEEDAFLAVVRADSQADRDAAVDLARRARAAA